MKKALIKEIEEDVNFLHTAEDRLKQNSLKRRKINDEIRELRALRDKLQADSDAVTERCKSIAIKFENIQNGKNH